MNFYDRKKISPPVYTFIPLKNLLLAIVYSYGMGQYRELFPTATNTQQ